MSLPTRGRPKKAGARSIKICCFGVCKSDTRFLKDQAIRFYRFPKPCKLYRDHLPDSEFRAKHVISDCSQCSRCQKWVKLARRADGRLNLDTIGYTTFVCSKHFRSGLEADESTEDPLPATVDATNKPRPRKPPKLRETLVPPPRKPRVNKKKDQKENLVFEPTVNTVFNREEFNCDLRCYEAPEGQNGNSERSKDQNQSVETQEVIVVLEDISLEKELAIDPDAAFTIEIKRLALKWMCKYLVSLEDNSLVIMKEDKPSIVSLRLQIFKHDFKLHCFGKEVTEKCKRKAKRYFGTQPSVFDGFIELIFNFPICSGYDLEVSKQSSVAEMNQSLNNEQLRAPKCSTLLFDMTSTVCNQCMLHRCRLEKINSKHSKTNLKFLNRDVLIQRCKEMRKRLINNARREKRLRKRIENNSGIGCLVVMNSEEELNIRIRKNSSAEISN